MQKKEVHIFIRPKVKASQMTINSRTNEKLVICLLNGITQHENEQYIPTWKYK